MSDRLVCFGGRSSDGLNARRWSSMQAWFLGREIVEVSLDWIKTTSATAPVSYDVG